MLTELWAESADCHQGCSAASNVRLDKDLRGHTGKNSLALPDHIDLVRSTGATGPIAARAKKGDRTLQHLLRVEMCHNAALERCLCHFCCECLARRWNTGVKRFLTHLGYSCPSLIASQSYVDQATRASKAEWQTACHGVNELPAAFGISGSAMRVRMGKAEAL